MTTTGAMTAPMSPSRPDLLEAIVAATRHAVATAEEARPRRDVDREAARRDPRGAELVDALRSRATIPIIAECKRRSPSKGVLRAAYEPTAIAAAYAAAGAAAISVLTEPAFFDGRLEHLRAVRAAVNVPLLRKDFIVTEYQLVEARAAGADAALLIVAALDDHSLRHLVDTARTLELAALVEVHDDTELSRAFAAGATLVGVNNRNLRTLEVDLDSSFSLVSRIPDGVVAVAESGIHSAADLLALRDAGYDAFLIGERFMTREDPGAALAQFVDSLDARPRGKR